MSLLNTLVKAITKKFAFMEFPLSMSRQGDFPLDKSSLWWDLNEATTYASSDPTAYPGQPITVVDEAANTVTLYVVGTKGELVAQGGMASVDALKQALEAHKADYNKLKTAYEATKADVTKLRQDHDALNSKHTALDTKVTELDTHEKQLKADHDTLAGKHAQLQTDHTALDGKVTALSGKHDTLQKAHDTLATDEAQLKKDHAALKSAFESKVYTADEITETGTRVFVTPAQKAVIDTVVYATEADIDSLFPELKPKV